MEAPVQPPQPSEEHKQAQGRAGCLLGTPQLHPVLVGSRSLSLSCSRRKRGGFVGPQGDTDLALKMGKVSKEL